MNYTSRDPSGRLATSVPEEDVINALCKAQRLRTPVILAMAGDYAGMDVALGIIYRPFVVLGAFTVTDSFVSNPFLKSRYILTNYRWSLADLAKMVPASSRHQWFIGSSDLSRAPQIPYHSSPRMSTSPVSPMLWRYPNCADRLHQA